LTLPPKAAPSEYRAAMEPEHRDHGLLMWCRLSFVDPSLGELDAFQPGIMRRLEDAPDAAQSSYSPDAFTFPAHYDAKLPASAAAGGQFDEMNVMSIMFEFHNCLATGCEAPRYLL
jgi:hypothetical protein